MHGWPVPDVPPQVRGGEDHAEVGTQGRFAGVGGADPVPYDAPRAVAADQVIRRDHGAPAVPVGHRHPHPALVLLDVGHRESGRQLARGQFPDYVAEQFFQHVLRGLLAELGEAVAVGRQPEHAGEPGQLAAGQ